MVNHSIILIHHRLHLNFIDLSISKWSILKQLSWSRFECPSIYASRINMISSDHNK